VQLESRLILVITVLVAVGDRQADVVCFAFVHTWDILCVWPITALTTTPLRFTKTTSVSPSFAAFLRDPLDFTMENELETALEWIGFANPEHYWARLLGEVSPDLSTFLRFTEKEISSVQKEMAENRTAVLRITFGLARTKFLKSMIHWAQDFNRVNATPSLDGLDRESFLAALIVAEQRARIRAQMTAICETRAKDASPGTLESKKQWNTEQALCTQLGILLGVNGVPLV
jgi:hypothetical protein